MKINFKEDWKLLSKRAAIFYVIFTIVNILTFILLLTQTDAGFVSPLIYLVFWQVAIWVYYMFRYKYRKNVAGGEWIDAGMFAIIAATLIRTFFIEAYQIPTSSMEKSMLRGDFLFVSKMNYGARVPMTPISFPFVHQEMPVIGGKAYSEALKLPFYRLPGFQKIKNNDIVVFNYPYELITQNSFAHPTDKKTNYIKRCIGIPGDTLKIVNGKVYINGKATAVAVHGQSSYVVQLSNTLSFKDYEKLNISEIDQTNGEGSYLMQLTKQNIIDLKNTPGVVSIQPVVDDYNATVNLPEYCKTNKWTVDNFGALYIPLCRSLSLSLHLALYLSFFLSSEGFPTASLNSTPYHLQPRLSLSLSVSFSVSIDISTFCFMHVKFEKKRLPYRLMWGSRTVKTRGA